ncbi:transcriptional regulator [Zobellella endophytica]|uniref:Transcriptional regulator n=1 Tax=Zobellella endophytica TaxID=2116700 RepID=A0A2P7R0P4_9GAMM|nr:cupin domain-containing protein [Zobellella endophytica]PSJ43792.1 transcriptional regulator [Zobellella endophytica]
MSKSLEDVIVMGRHPVPAETMAPNPDTLVAGHPVQTLANHYSSADNRFHVGTWGSEPGRWRINYTEHEYCKLLKGRVILHDQAGNRLTLTPGDDFIIPAGFRGEWETVESCEKIYVIYQP